jgi:hypothetical protein
MTALTEITVDRPRRCTRIPPDRSKMSPRPRINRRQAES